jgi:dipeptidyl aminopeptidase/acylaminoacyl peptidase
VTESGLLYARLRYGLDLRRASPAAALRGCHTPVLLIHGTADEKTPIRHSRELRAINPEEVKLWEVPGARHTTVLADEPETYARTVVDWFRTHP